MVDHRPGKRDAPGVFLRHLVGDDQAAHLVDGFGVGEERGGVPVVAHAQGDQVKARALGAFQAEAVAQLGLIARCGDMGVQFALHAVNLLRLERDMIEESFAGHAVVAVRGIGRNGALIHPVEVKVFPGHAGPPGLVGVGEKLEGRLGSGPTADGDARSAACGHGF